ncbi:adenylate/guanylate cyclase domain-containing protein [Mesorhizobium sp.]|uniref:adenylate/guanylate cyclase domain-containing protein n=1 Tax=Mesorhizobium sp. TaxID=1871066 RepID=UPI000FE8FFBD|nr:adenylate/guanylate cyclase domain-containing protein [Mesorhizobium sp.]RWK55743.1 MAG: adenylate/guanylate cyclase domain-containing protein [Mesorhizobium sp.]TIP39759.1 MAG: adenylate/guanylate cyclase domain-containing protein [Mesorhizobium sp.]
MADERAKRRLAAIAVFDVVGYSRLMEADETGTLAALRERRKTVLEPIVRDHKGRIVKVMGDGVLVEFASAVNAVKAALELQEKMAEANTLLSEDRRIVLRIGINLGDIIGEGSDVYGDGVNIAARLEALAEPGGICVSAKVRDETHGRLELAFEDMGEQQLKNIANPVRVFRVATCAVSSAAVGPSLSLPDKPSIAVLPFTNMSGDPEQQYFSDGITEDIITELSRSRSLFVIARNSSFQYRDKGVDVRRVARDLGVRYVVEGSVRKMGSRIRITAQLIDAVPGNHLWSERFDRGIEELFDVQDELTQTIVATVTGRLEDAEIRMATNKRTDSLPAYDCLLRGIQHLRGYGPDENHLARELFEQAVALDPRYALAHAYLALALLVENHYGGASDSIKQRALDIATAAVRLDPRDSRCHTFLGQVYRFRDEYDLAISHLERGVALNPNDAIGIVHLAGVLGVSGRAEEGIELLHRAIRLDPYLNFFWGTLALCLYALRRYEEALVASQNIWPTKSPWQMAREAACLAQLGRLDEARAKAAEVLRRKPGFSVRAEMPHYRYPADAEHLRKGLLKAGLPE